MADVPPKFPRTIDIRPGGRRARRLFLISVLLFFMAGPAESAENRHVLVLNSYHQGFLWSDNIMAGLQAVFVSQAPEVELYIEYLDTKRYRLEELEPVLTELYKLKKSFPYDLIVAADNNAFQFLLEHPGLLDPGRPVVFCGINDFDEAMLQGRRHITGVVEDFDLAGTIRLALAMHPDTANIAVISDASVTGALNLARFRQIEADFGDLVNFIALDNLTAAELAKALQELPAETIILALSYYLDRAGQAYTPRESLAFINRHSTVPVYSAWDHTVASGALGGLVVSGRVQGEKAAQLAIRILGGEAVENIPIIRNSPNIVMFNFQQMQRFGLARNDLPPGSVVLYEPQHFYYRYRPYIWLAGLFAVLQTAVILFLWSNVRRRRRAELGLRESEACLRGTFEQAAVGIARLAPDGRWLQVNQKLCEIVGYREDELLTMKFQDITPAEDLTAERQYIEEMLAGTRRTFAIEKRYVRKDQSLVWINRTVSLIREEPGGAPKYFISVVEDITGRKEAEEKLNKTYQQLLHAEKLGSIGKMAASFAHEFNNPLCGVMNVLEGLHRRIAFAEEDAELVGAALDECHRMANLIRNLQEFNRPTTGRFTAMDLNAVIDAVLLLVEKNLNANNIFIQKDYDQHLPLVLAVVDQIKQVILNLLDNAGDACAGGGTIRISTSLAGSNAVLKIQDSGKGIKPQDMPHIFEPFFTTKATVKGTGLGLSICYGIVKFHGGTIRVHSEAGQGAVVTVTLPVATGAPAE